MTKAYSLVIRSRYLLCVTLVLAAASCLLSCRHAEETSDHSASVDLLAQYKPRIEWEDGEPVGIYFHDTAANLSLNDADLAVLRKFPELGQLSIEFAPNLSEAGMVHLSALSNLEVLSIKFAPITDDCLASLISLENLQVLQLYDTDVSDAGLEYLARMPRLRALKLCISDVSDAGLPTLSEIPNIQDVTLGVDDSEITRDGVLLFRQDYPSIRVHATRTARHAASPTPEPTILGKGLCSGPEAALTLVLAAQRIDDTTVTQLVIGLTPSQLTAIGVTDRETEHLGAALYEAIEDRLPVGIVDWFSGHVAEKDVDRPQADQVSRTFSRDTPIVKFLVGCRSADSRGMSIVLR